MGAHAGGLTCSMLLVIVANKMSCFISTHESWRISGLACSILHRGFAGRGLPFDWTGRPVLTPGSCLTNNYKCVINLEIIV